MSDSSNTKVAPEAALTWLVYGARGWIGGMLCDEIREARPLDRVVEAQARLDDCEAVAAELDAVEPQRVVCAAGRTHGPGCPTIDYLEGGVERTKENVRDNLFAPVSLGLMCAARGMHLLYVGTGCIFNHDDTPMGRSADVHRWGEDEAPNFFGSSYSVVKGYTDRLMHQTPLSRTVLNARIRMPIVADDKHPRNFITKIASYERVIDVPNSVTVLPDLLPLMVDMAARGETGTCNFVNPGAVTHNEVLDLYRRYLKPDLTWRNMSVDEQRHLLKADRSNNELDASRLATLYPDRVLPARDAIERMLCRERRRRLLTSSSLAASANNNRNEDAMA